MLTFIIIKLVDNFNISNENIEYINKVNINTVFIFFIDRIKYDK